RPVSPSGPSSQAGKQARPAAPLPPDPPARRTPDGPPGHAATDPRPRVRGGSPSDVLAVVPHLFGFHPARSLVVIGAGGSREHVKLGFRYDLPDPPDAGAAAGIAEHAVSVLASRQVTSVIVVGYGPGPLVTP